MTMDYNIFTEISKNNSILNETKSVQLEKIQRMDEWMPCEWSDTRNEDSHFVIWMK